MGDDEKPNISVARIKPVRYNRHNENLPVVSTGEFKDWLHTIKDWKTRYRIVQRIDRLAAGNHGDAKALGGGGFELRFTFGPGYRVYFTHRNQSFFLLLLGGDKSTQKSDIRKTRRLTRSWQSVHEEETHGDT